MKTKLLKKLHKRYSWYFNSSKFPVLIDHDKQIATVYDTEYCCSLAKYKVEDLPTLVKVPLDEWALRAMKFDILQKYGWSITKVYYKLAVNKLKSKQK